MFEPEKTYHVYNRANGKENLFKERQNYEFFLKKYFNYIQPVAETFAYCLMPNHFHLMIKTRSEEETIERLGAHSFQKYGTYSALISKQFSNLFSSYTQSFNKVYGRSGSLFQPNMKRKEVQSDTYFTQLILYIHNNPVNHGFVGNLYLWKFSSVHQLCSDEPSDLQRQSVLNWFGDPIGFKKAHEDMKVSLSVFD